LNAPLRERSLNLRFERTSGERSLNLRFERALEKIKFDFERTYKENKF